MNVPHTHMDTDTTDWMKGIINNDLEKEGMKLGGRDTGQWDTRASECSSLGEHLSSMCLNPLTTKRRKGGREKHTPFQVPAHALVTYTTSKQVTLVRLLKWAFIARNIRPILVLPYSVAEGMSGHTIVWPWKPYTLG